MSNGNNFWDSGSVSEYDLMAEEIDEQAQQILDEYSDEEPEEEYEEEYEDEEYEEEETMSDYEPTKRNTAYKLDKRESSVVNDAMIRLEQARLYDMLIKHDMFKGVKAHPAALENVKTELKSYIVSRLEVLLGIRKEKVDREIPKQVQVELPFNDIEIEFLKALSYKGTKGASAQADTRKVVATEVLPTMVASQKQQELHGLQPLSYDEEEYEEEEEYVEPPKPKKVVKKKQVAKRPKPTPTPSRGQPVSQAPVKKHKPSRAKLDRKGEISDSEAERIAREDMERMKGRKPVDQMTPTELLEANRRISSGKTKVQGAKPIPNAQQLSMQYQMQQMNNTSNPGSNGFNMLLNKILSEK